MGKSKKLIVFDLDGTLNRTELYAVEIHRMVQTEFGWHAQTPEQIQSVFGALTSEYMPLLLPGADKETQRRYLKRVAEVEKDYLHLAAAYDGSAQMLDELHGKGWETAVCSNSSSRYISTILNAIRLTDKIDHIEPLDKAFNSKKASLKNLLDRLKPEKAVMVGDTSFDEEAAEENGIPFIGCLYGFRPHEMENAPIAVERPAQIPEAAESLL
ncbi:HAD family hydrolase [Ruminococcaceae bacterium BL-6]|nr:HAD family hydrolase [Ruminococcaceae bacterium BL-6]